MKLKLLSEGDKEALFHFEIENKKWFEEFVPPRPAEYFELSSFSSIVDTLLKEQGDESCFLYVVYHDDRIVARINVTNLSNETAEIGYRVGKGSVGRGIATRAVSQLIEICRSQYTLKKLIAKTTRENLSSQHVLKKCGFTLVRVIPEAASLNNKKVDFLYYERSL